MFYPTMHYLCYASWVLVFDYSLQGMILRWCGFSLNSVLQLNGPKTRPKRSVSGLSPRPTGIYILRRTFERNIIVTRILSNSRVAGWIHRFMQWNTCSYNIRNLWVRQHFEFDEHSIVWHCRSLDYPNFMLVQWDKQSDIQIYLVSSPVFDYWQYTMLTYLINAFHRFNGFGWPFNRNFILASSDAFNKKYQKLVINRTFCYITSAPTIRHLPRYTHQPTAVKHLDIAR